VSQSRAARRSAWLTLASASVIAGVTSYAHALTVVQAADGQPWWSYPQPALTDLVVIGASAAILDSLRTRRWPPCLPVLSLVAAVGVTMAMNLAVSDPHAIPKWVVNGWTAVAFMAALESALGIVRRGRGDSAAVVFSQDQAAGPPSTDDALSLLLKTKARRPLAAELGVTPYRVEQWAKRVTEPSAAGLNGGGRE
jgi:hypothetical protein